MEYFKAQRQAFHWVKIAEEQGKLLEEMMEDFPK